MQGKGKLRQHDKVRYSQNSNTNLNNILSNVTLFSHIVLCSFIIIIYFRS